MTGDEDAGNYSNNINGGETVEFGGGNCNNVEAERRRIRKGV